MEPSNILWDSLSDLSRLARLEYTCRQIEWHKFNGKPEGSSWKGWMF